MKLLDRLLGRAADTDDTDAVSVSELSNITALNTPISGVSGIGTAPARVSWLDGDKFPGGFGVTELWLKDYWTLRQRSGQLFENNLFARGLIRRLVTNIINTGLTLEAFPEESILGYGDGDLDEWSETTENRFRLWAGSPHLCDYYQRDTWWAIQQTAYRESLIDGDILVVMRQSPETRLPMVQLVKGSKVQTPMGKAADDARRAGHTIEHGVELDQRGRHVAYHIVSASRKPLGGGAESERIPAFGPRTGRRMAWLMYGCDRREGNVRGDPLLSLVLQSLRELDRYRDAAQRKAVINSMVAMFIRKDADKPGTMPLTGAGTRRDQIVSSQDPTGERRYDMQGQIPGVVMEELQTGETPQAFGMDGTDINYQAFEAGVVRAIAWAHQIPPEILELSFQNNYSASQAAINEFKMFLNPERAAVGKQFCQPIYCDWLLSEALLQRVDAPGLLDAWADPSQYDIYAAWTQTDWTGAIKPSTDLVKQARGHGMLLDRGLTTHSRATAEITGMSFNRNVKRLRREHEQIARAFEPIREIERDDGAARDGRTDERATVLELVSRVDDLEDTADGDS